MNNKKSTKRALISSVLSLVLCMSMLIGTTFAWFTDNVSSANNKIVAGNLKVDLELLNKETNVWNSVKTDKTPIFDYELWEPGYVDVKILKVENEGNLALKWKAQFVSSAELTGLADVIDVYVKEGVDAYPANRDDIKDWTKVGTVSQFVNTIETTTTGELKATESETLGIALKMREEAGNEYQGMNLGGTFDIVVTATQLTAEDDSFDNQYDVNAKYDREIWDGKSVTAPVAYADGVYHITTAAELVGMMDVTGNSIYNGKTILLENNIDLAGRTVKGIGGISTNFSGVFDGQGYTISNFKIDSTGRDYFAGLFNQVSHGGTIKNLTVKNATVKGTSMVGAVASSLDANAVIDNCKAIDCTLIGVKKVGAVVGYTSGSTVTNNYAENCMVLYSKKEGGEVLGFENTGSTVSNNTAKNVTVSLEIKSAEALKDALAAGKKEIYAEGVVVEGTTQLNKGATIIGATFKNESGIAVTKTISGTFKDCVFEGSEALRWCYSTAGETVVFENCKFKTDFRGIHFDGMNGDVIFRNCEINGFNAFGGAGTVTFENCTFGNDKSNYNGLNMYSNIKLIDCTFNFVEGKTNFIDMEGTGKTLEITNCKAIYDGVEANIKDFVGGSMIEQNTVVIK